MEELIDMYTPALVQPETMIIHPEYIRPYTFDILSVVVYAMNNPAQHAFFTKTLYDRVSQKLRIKRFEEMPKYIGIEVEKDEEMSHIDTEDYIRKQLGCSVLNNFSELLCSIPGFGTLPGGEAMRCIEESFPILNVSPAGSTDPVYHICFGI